MCPLPADTLSTRMLLARAGVMEFVGIIQSKPDPPGIDRSAWMALVKARNDLLLPQPRAGVNPFTKKPVMFDPPKDSANVFVNEQHVGSFHWSQNEENVISVWGDLAHVRPIAEGIARELGGVFLAADDVKQ